MEIDNELRGTYQQVDFEVLATKDEYFREVWDKANGHLDFQQPQTCTALSKAILKVDFGLELELPHDRLCPPIPNRWNYVQWIQTLIESTSPNYADIPELTRRYDPNRKVVGLDIGTGASAIYALLSLKTRPNWDMCVTDVDKESFDAAARNLAINNMLTRTRMVHTIESDNLISLRAFGVDALDFVICNPPFFTDEQDMQASLTGEGKSSSPNAVCTGAQTEMVCPGGDLGFVTRIVTESLELRDKVTWYSSMLGKLSSTKAIIELLKKNGIQNWAVGSLKPGRATKRWVVAWSFGDLRPPNNLARPDGLAHEYLPFPTQYIIPLFSSSLIVVVKNAIDTQLSVLDLHWTGIHKTGVGVGEASRNVWNRAYRREQQKRQDTGDTETTAKDDDKVALAFRISVFEEPEKKIVVDWVRGTDSHLWESFCGMLHRHYRYP
ncbi:hypothetical protein K491DRAFT_697720 [Lophiostoma macrostomum CBS 122681]|uniref:U6 small nuclear RNA (adenine-(43)-N(6))-methyltransferase n=1 Tax=Lophiostoma macrostomum CBS 122681 TaxID=1314788 RepID=A0A6A6SSE2_9PLEO|nr:hypothetical protein K491DRAFT_697720 [Lophiostoma macrostomum CBS 122681]